MSNRFHQYKDMHEEPLPGSLRPSNLRPDEFLFLALHVRDRLLDRIANVPEDDERVEWIDTIALGFADLLRRCDIKDHHVIYHGQSDWHTSVRPPSVIASALMMFLGGLSVANPSVFDGCSRRGSVQGYMCVLDGLKGYFDSGAQERGDHSSA